MILRSEKGMKHKGMLKTHASGILSGRNPVLYLFRRASSKTFHSTQRKGGWYCNAMMVHLTDPVSCSGKKDRAQEGVTVQMAIPIYSPR